MLRLGGAAEPSVVCQVFRETRLFYAKFVFREPRFFGRRNWEMEKEETQRKRSSHSSFPPFTIKTVIPKGEFLSPVPFPSFPETGRLLGKWEGKNQTFTLFEILPLWSGARNAYISEPLAIFPPLYFLFTFVRLCTPCVRAMALSSWSPSPCLN